MPYTATLSAILRTTTEPRPLANGHNGPIAWHSTQTELILSDANTSKVQLNACGFGGQGDLLALGHTYHLSGPFGQRPSGASVIKYSSLTQADIGIIPPEQAQVAGKAIISGIGKVISFEYDDVADEDGSWNLTIDAEHNYFDPEISTLTKISS
ncbi:uncharacterized protein MELLADRAFT_107487 [Melampsora larici-populina 98AG31]|uniref:Uncharacterized protein n=1 Tax=Melampsora larici-populina (strain 98AG31 / pathotype 3-4-7) TaxID=747676 RepID=F4RPZ3_MELLP|nr:uncharacterized protein MELLADRAFT_107487 [Melampsora larici-populina 98AG31]EGG05626.1 hypothetical protein MELLADRAFT_107487 [Melampsora larici-populina 98AG31]